MITIRLDPKIERVVNATAKNLGITKSDLIRKSIIEYIGKFEKATAWELGKEYFGKYSSGMDNLSAERKTIVKEKIRAKRE